MPTGRDLILTDNFIEWSLGFNIFCFMKHNGVWTVFFFFFFFFFFLNPPFKIAMSGGAGGWAGVGRWASGVWCHPRLTFNCRVNIFFFKVICYLYSSSLSYLVGMKRWTSRCFTYKRQLSLSSLFKKPVLNAVRRFSCIYTCTWVKMPYSVWCTIQYGGESFPQ